MSRSVDARRQEAACPGLTVGPHVAYAVANAYGTSSAKLIGISPAKQSYWDTTHCVCQFHIVAVATAITSKRIEKRRTNRHRRNLMTSAALGSETRRGDRIERKDKVCGSGAPSQCDGDHSVNRLSVLAAVVRPGGVQSTKAALAPGARQGLPNRQPAREIRQYRTIGRCRRRRPTNLG
jgi:hypothetical protein